MLQSSDRPGRRATGHRYAPMPFRHNIRIGSILLPTLVVLVGFGGKLSVATIMIGAMVRPSTLTTYEGSAPWQVYLLCGMMALNANCVQYELNMVSTFYLGRVHHGCFEVQRGCSWCNMDYLGPGKPEHAGL